MKRKRDEDHDIGSFAIDLRVCANFFRSVDLMMSITSCLVGRVCACDVQSLSRLLVGY